MLDCWKEEPKQRPDFGKLVETISLTLEAALVVLYSTKAQWDCPHHSWKT